MPDQTPESPEPLSDEEKRVIIDKGTERPFSGKYWNTFDSGVYLCRQCNAPLYLSRSKFESDCGWPSFDDALPHAIQRQADPDGRRTEIVCTSCKGHLGHVFEGEGFTPTNTRHCVNSVSLLFSAAADPRRAIFAGGCFWGIDYMFRSAKGVISTRSGYTGGSTANPTYADVCSGDTGHAESVEVIYDASQVTYEHLARLFFEIHDPAQKNRQGPDVGSQYRSAVFYLDDSQRDIANRLVEELERGGLDVATELVPAGDFWPAEEHHQNYIAKHPGRSCHARVKRFED